MPTKLIELRRKIKSGASQVYFGSARVARTESNATLPAKLKRLLQKFDLAHLCQQGRVPIKMHLGGDLGFTTIHPVFVRVVVETVKAAGGKPFVVEGGFEAVATAANRGYTPETIGCPIVSGGGPFDSHLVERRTGLPGLNKIRVFGAIWDAPCLINFSHVKGHGDCGYAGACKNIAMGCVDGWTRSKIHALEGGIAWRKERCTLCGQCVKACKTGAISIDAKKKTLSIFFHDCRYCAHCVTACPRAALVLRNRQGYRRFQEGMAVATKIILDSFAPERVLHINLLTSITMLCDCWGFSSPSIVPDIGVMAAQDMVALETASLNAIRKANLIPGSLIGDRKLTKGRHLLEQIHGKDPFVQVRALERRGVGQSKYRLVEVE